MHWPLLFQPHSSTLLQPSQETSAQGWPQDNGDWHYVRLGLREALEAYPRVWHSIDYSCSIDVDFVQRPTADTQTLEINDKDFEVLFRHCFGEQVMSVGQVLALDLRVHC